MERIKLAGVAVQKCASGDPISDEEIDAGIAVLNQVIPALHAMGECYYLAYADLNRRLSTLEGFRQARKQGNL